MFVQLYEGEPGACWSTDKSVVGPNRLVVSVTFTVKDPETGEDVPFTAYPRNGKLVIQRLPPHNFLENASPRRMEVIAQFMEVASGAYGEKGTGGLPPAAKRVQDLMPARAKELESPPQSKSSASREANRRLIGPEVLERLGILLAAEERRERRKMERRVPKNEPVRD